MKQHSAKVSRVIGCGALVNNPRSCDSSAHSRVTGPVGGGDLAPCTPTWARQPRIKSLQHVQCSACCPPDLLCGATNSSKVYRKCRTTRWPPSVVGRLTAAGVRPITRALGHRPIRMGRVGETILLAPVTHSSYMITAPHDKVLKGAVQ